MIGCAILGLGIWLKIEKGDYVDISQYDYLTSANVAIGIGVVFLVISFLGCCGAIKEVAPMLISFFILLLLIFLLEIVIGIFAYVERSELDHNLKEDLTEVMLKRYTKAGEEGLTKAVDIFQERFDCCGVDLYSDWKQSSYYDVHGSLPATCCKTDVSKTVCPTIKETEWGKVYKSKGCFTELKDFLKENLLYIGITAIVFAIFQILGMIFSMVLYRAVR